MWGFLLQTLTASLVAALLLAVKWLLRDKLSPRWQYGVWSILAVRILIPAGVLPTSLLPLSLWVETLKGAAERRLDSAYTAVYEPVSGFCSLRGMPKSWTDWLLVIYLAGVAVSLLWYFCSYVRLRMLLKKGRPHPTEQIQRVCRQYGLKACPAVQVPGLPSAFVCGVIKPILAVPADSELDDKIMLHELLHLKHYDAPQNVFWCVCRGLHWCNPFLQYVFHQIGNDMESLCDQRVLERLEGEERREYGKILLQMANGRYARAPGTTSISNGGRRIAERIAAIVRFKSYPKGMALVSVCITVVLLVPCLLGNGYASDASVSRPVSVRDLDAAMAYARLERCDTVAGALDTYAKGLLEENGVYLAVASSLSRHRELEAQMRQNAVSEGWVAYHYAAGEGLECLDGGSVYQIFGLSREKDGYAAWLLISVYGFLDEEGFPVRDADGEWEAGFVLVPVSVTHEDAWVVEEAGERICVPIPLTEAGEAGWNWPFVKAYAADGMYGSVTVQSVTRYFTERDNTFSHNPFYGGSNGHILNPDCDFQNAVTFYETSYRPAAPVMKKISVQVAVLENEEEAIFREYGSFHGTGGDSEGRSWFSTPDNGPVELPLTHAGVRHWDLAQDTEPLPGCCKCQVYHAGVLMETLTLTEVAHE